MDKVLSYLKQLLPKCLAEYTKYCLVLKTQIDMQYIL